MIIHSMKGLGDNCYQRAFVKALPKPVYLDTPWPEIYQDIPGVHFIRPQTTLRTQAKNIARHTNWILPPGRQPTRQIRYGAEGIIPGMTACFGVAPAEFDLPRLPPSPVDGRYVVVRPVTVRSEWRADTRNPLPSYIALAAIAAMDRGYKVVVVADLQDGQEWLVGEHPPPADVYYLKGELPVEQLLALVKGAAAVIGGIGWLVPAALCAKVPAWIVCGGQGGYNAPELITPKGQTNITFAVPDRFCRCKLKQHNCDKGISNYDAKLASWFDGLPPLES
jgi:hypothetical protein